MGQEDYLLREIEKAGVALRAILKRLMSGREDLSVPAGKSFEETSGMLLDGIGIDMVRLLSMSPEESEAYVSSFRSLNSANMELLSDVLFRLRTGESPEMTKSLLEKALLLLEMCNIHDRTYSFDRESRIGEIKSLLDDDGRA